MNRPFESPSLTKKLAFNLPIVLEFALFVFLATGAGRQTLDCAAGDWLNAHANLAPIAWKILKVATLCMPAVILWTIFAAGVTLFPQRAASTAAKIVARLNAIPIAKTRLFCVAVFGCFVLLNAWQCDDAFHSHRLSFNLTHGNGLVYNIGERVNAATCPLWTLLVAAAGAVFGDIPVTSTLLCVLLSTAAAGIVLHSLPRRPIIVFFTTAALLCSRSFTSYTTSGLENSLLFFLFAALLAVFLRPTPCNAPRIAALALLTGLIATTRMDNLLFALPVLGIAVWKREKELSLCRVIPLLLAGFTPFILWETFAIIYYGFPFPNTAYAKIAAAFPAGDYLVRGAWYFFDALYCDALLLLAPAVLARLALKTKDPRLLALGSGILLYFLFVLNVGGDFMSGRHFTVAYFIAVTAISTAIAQPDAPPARQWCAFFGKRLFQAGSTVRHAALALGLLLFLQIHIGVFSGFVYWWNPVQMFLNRNGWEGNAFFIVGDERSVYMPFYSARAWLAKKINPTAPRPEHWATTGKQREIMREIERSDAEGEIVLHAVGASRFHFARDKYVNDSIALGDPLLARLKGTYHPNWMVGHVRRKIPAGYRESIRTGTNRIKDPNLHKYLDVLWEITRGETLFSIPRLEKIIRINLGGYQDLLDAYENGPHETEPPFTLDTADIRRQRPPKTNTGTSRTQ